MSRFFCISLIVSFIIFVQCGTLPDIEKAFDDCKKELNLPEEKLKGPPNLDDPETKCFDACMMKKLGKIVDGKIVLEKELALAATNLPDGVSDDTKAKITECFEKANQEVDECEVAGTFHKCYEEKLGPFKDCSSMV